MKSIGSRIYGEFLFFPTWSLLFENSSRPFVTDSKTYFLTCQGNLGTLTPKSKLQVGSFIPFTKTSVESNWNNLEQVTIVKVVKFQYRLKIHNAQLNIRLFTQKVLGLKVQFLYENLQNIEIFKNLWLRISKSKLAYHPSSWMIFSNLRQK